MTFNPRMGLNTISSLPASLLLLPPIVSVASYSNSSTSGRGNGPPLLLAFYLAIHHSRFMLKAWPFTMFTDHWFFNQAGRACSLCALVCQSIVSFPGLGSRSRVFLAPWSRRRLKKKTRSWSMEKKSGAGAARKLAGSSALREDKNIRKLYFSYSSLGKILSFMVKKTIILLV